MPGGRPRFDAAAGSSAVKTVAKVLDILEHLGDVGRPVTVSEVARADRHQRQHGASSAADADRARTTSSRIAATRGYTLGPRTASQLGSAYACRHRSGQRRAAVPRGTARCHRRNRPSRDLQCWARWCEVCQAGGQQAVSGIGAVPGARAGLLHGHRQGDAGGLWTGGARRISAHVAVAGDARRRQHHRARPTAARSREGARASGFALDERGVRPRRVLHQRAGARSGRSGRVAAHQHRDAEDALPKAPVPRMGAHAAAKAAARSRSISGCHQLSNVG